MNLETIQVVETIALVKKYCERDVTIVQNFLTKINEQIHPFHSQWFNDTYSISGLALKIFYNNFNTYNIPHSIDIKISNLIRPAYYGGRCEVFGNPTLTDQIFHFDFSGMYSNRLKELFPYGEPFNNNNPTDCHRPGFYYITISSDLQIPILPYRHPKTNKLLFPNGSFSGLYWYEEINLFIKNNGKIKKIHWSIEFKQQAFLFKEFAETCISLRKKTTTGEILWKLIPNSFIGRLGLKETNEETVIIHDSFYEPFNMNVIIDKKINNQWIVRIKKERKKPIKNNVIYPAIITAKARILWWESAQIVINNGGRLLYCDTDSIFVAFNKNVIGETHGVIHWTEESKIEKACFATNKVYCIQSKNITTTKMKGVSNKNIDNNFENFLKFFLQNEKKKISTIIFNKGFLKMQISEINKVIDFSNYDKRIFINKKYDTIPIKINTLYNNGNSWNTKKRNWFTWVKYKHGRYLNIWNTKKRKKRISLQLYHNFKIFF